MSPNRGGDWKAGWAISDSRWRSSIYEIADLTCVLPEFRLMRTTLRRAKDREIPRTCPLQFCFQSQGSEGSLLRTVHHTSGWHNAIIQHWRQTYPNTVFVVKNLAIGGFSSEQLEKTTERDIDSFYPDLIIFHV